MAGVIWKGADGNYYAKSSDFDGVKNVTNVVNDPTNPWIDIINGYDVIDDPNPPAKQTTTAPAYTGGGAAEPAPVLDQAAVEATQKAIDALSTQREVGFKNIEDDYSHLIGGYKREAERNEGDYGENVVTNNTNLQKNKQNALVSAAQGRRGLRGVLASIGALFGTGGRLADRAVTTEANQDIGGAADTAAENAQQLDTAIGRFREEDENRREEAKTARRNQRTALAGTIAADRQKLYKSMADIYKEAEDTDAASNWLRKAGDLNEYIASHTRVASTPFSKMAAAYTPGELADYLAGAGDMTVQVAPTGGESGITQPSILAGPTRRKRREALVPAAV